MIHPKDNKSLKSYSDKLLKHVKETFFLACNKLKKYQPYLSSLWVRVELFAGKLFALTDHSKLRKARSVFRISVALVATFFLWATFFDINQVVHSQGEIIASAYTQVIQSADGGVLSELKVREGDSVKMGEVIAILEKERAQASYAEVRDKIMATRMTVIRLRAEIAGQPLIYDESTIKSYPDLYQTQLSLYKQKTRTIDEQLKLLKQNVGFAEQELNMAITLEKMGDISKVDVLRLNRAVNDARNLHATTKNRYLQEASAELNKAQEDLEIQQQTLLDREQLVKHTDIIAPATGIVKSIKYTTPGAVIRQGDEIMQILPTESDLVVEAKIKPGDMGNIKPGRIAKIKLDAFDSSIFGSMNGKVTYVSADALKEDSRSGPVSYYRVLISIGEQDSKLSSRSQNIEVRPGMTVSVDIETGKRSVIAYLFKPLVKTFKGALGER